MNADHIEGTRGTHCLCDDCTRGYTLATPRVMGGEDIAYALAKLREEVSGTAGWSQADWRAATLAASAGGYLGAVRLPSTPMMVPAVPVCCPQCGCMGDALRQLTWPIGAWDCTHCGRFTPVAARNPSW